jgi:hypothetical protein
MSCRCPYCDFETGFTPIAIKALNGATTCPMCGRTLPIVATEGALDETLRRMEQENSPLFDHLSKKMLYRSTRKKMVFWATALTAVLLAALLGYLLFVSLS